MPKVSNHFPDLLTVANSLDTAEVLENVKQDPAIVRRLLTACPQTEGTPLKGNGRRLTWLHTPAMAAFQRLRQEYHHEFQGTWTIG